MTTTTQRKPITVQIVRGEKTTVGRRNSTVTAVTITADEYTWNAFVTARDEWWEACFYCLDATGYKPEYAGIYGGVCFQCGGIGVRRMAGSERTLTNLIRRRVSSRRGHLNSTQRREERERAAAEDYRAAHPNLASDLARERAYGTLGRNPLGDMALRVMERPLSVPQERFATALLVQRAWEEAHVIECPPVESVHAGVVGERVTLTGEIVVWKYLPTDRPDRSNRVMLIIDARTPDGKQAALSTYTAARWAMEAKKGDTVTVRGVVDNLVDDQYGKTTRIVRPALIQ